MTLPDFTFEKNISERGYKLIAGIDEVGRGSFAGPVVTGCVVFDLANWVLPLGSPKAFPPASRHPSIIIDDSKKLSSKQREVADIWIRKNAIGFGIGSASVAQINKFGIKKATEIAFRKAIKNCQVQIDYLLIDAFYIPYVKGLRRKNQKAIIKGDSLSVSIAAASIVAKVFRDQLMTNLGKKPAFEKYKWHQNKGYGTKVHRESIRKYGITKHHRKQFVESYLAKI
jgi:ribonuclease HII